MDIKTYALVKKAAAQATKEQLQDNPELTTGSKSVVGAINELKSDIDNFDILQLKGVKETEADLPKEGNNVGDVWYVKETKSQYAWIEEKGKYSWVSLGASESPIDIDIINGGNAYGIS